MKNISINDLKKYKDNNTLLIDVRMPMQYMANHIEGSINMPHTNILSMLKGYPKDIKIILYCDRGINSTRVGKILDGLGYTNIYILNKN